MLRNIEKEKIFGVGMIMNRKYYYNESGFAALVALLMVGMLTLIGLAALSTSEDEITMS